MNEGPSVRARCPYFQRVIREGRAILCSDEIVSGRRRSEDDTAVLPFRFLKLAFHDNRDRLAWSEDFCETNSFHACPIFQAMQTIGEDMGG